MKPSKASRLNKAMMFGMIIMAIIVFGCVFAMLYLSYDNTEEQSEKQDLYSISFDESLNGDSIIISINDSIVFHDIATNDTTVSASGYSEQNMISISDISDGTTINENLPTESLSLDINKNEDGLFVIYTER